MKTLEYQKINNLTNQYIVQRTLKFWYKDVNEGDCTLPKRSEILNHWILTIKSLKTSPIYQGSPSISIPYFVTTGHEVLEHDQRVTKTLISLHSNIDCSASYLYDNEWKASLTRSTILEPIKPLQILKRNQRITIYQIKEKAQNCHMFLT